LKWSDKAVSFARNIALALEEFKQENPEAYQQFQEILGKHRAVRRAYLEFGGEISDELCVQAIRDTMGDITQTRAEQVYRALRKLSDSLAKKKSQNLIHCCFLNKLVLCFFPQHFKIKFFFFYYIFVFN